MSVINFSRHVAVFYDDKGEYIGFKRIQYNWLTSFGKKKKTFDYGVRSFNINSQVSRGYFHGMLCDTFFYNYNINNPDPISLELNNVKPLMDPEVYKTRLNSKLVQDLNNAYKTGLAGLFTWKTLIVILIIGAIAYYFFSGGQLLPSSSPPVTPTP